MTGADFPDSLRDARCYPHAVAKIELCETHISWVLLTGEYAYKIKKPVKLSFLDFSTLAARKHFCEEELRLNRRFAPELYLGVVPITGDAQSPTIGGRGPVLDYAVKLKQFRRENELENLVAANQISLEQIIRFGESLAAVHATLPTVSGVSPDTFRRVVADNTSELLALRPQERSRIAGLRERLQLMHDRNRTLLDDRYGSEAIRECHGDLHLGNVVRIDEELKAFDCIEFDAALRNIDVLNDAGFLFMDLEAHDRRDLAYCFLNAWLQSNGDYLALPLLPYYVCYRALVRAKVAALQRQESAMARYLPEATRRSQDRAPRLILTCGLSGSGKTWLSKQLLTRLPAIHIRSDIERKRLAGIGAAESSRSLVGGGIYTPEFNTRTYQRLLDCARAGLNAGETVIVDAAFLRREERAAFSELADKTNASFAILHCFAPSGVLQERIQERSRHGQDASEATTEVLARQYDYWEPFTASEKAAVLEIDTRVDSPQSIVERLRLFQSALSK